MEAIARVYLVDDSCKHVRYDGETAVERVMHVVLQALGVKDLAYPHFALRLLTGPTVQSSDRLWLHPNLLLKNIAAHYAEQLSTFQLPHGDLRLELRIRFVPLSSYELMLTDVKGFYYLHQQVYADFLSQVAWKVSEEAALELAALYTCREHSEKRGTGCLDNKSGIDGIDVDAALLNCIPDTIRANPNNKPTHMRKQFIALLKRHSTLSHADNVLRSLSILGHIVKYDVEVFKACIGVGWTTPPIDLLVGAEVDISFRPDERCEATHLCELRNIRNIQIRRLDASTDKSVVQLTLSGSSNPLLITVATAGIAECLAHLLDGYQMMFNQSDSVYKLKGMEHCESVDVVRVTGQLAPVDDSDFILQRDSIILKELIGGGQFGNVYKGVLSQAGRNVGVAVKVCKSENEPADAQLILQEAHLMRNFKHAHIVAMLGACIEQPLWLVLELAPLGELRQYLTTNKGVIAAATQVLFCFQLASAVAYLHTQNYVHRDIAARNALVSSAECVKLSDFGLSRQLDYDAVYTASRGKLPIKWLAPESILYRAFSMASDVWMFGVLIWEIFSWGVKPWTGISNHDVIRHIEMGERPKKTNDCPEAIFDFLLHHMWAFEAHKRPTMSEVVRIMAELSDQLKRWVRPEHLRITRKAHAIPVIRTNIDALPNLTLWRTLEDQRRQAEEDDQWLAQEEHKMMQFDEDHEEEDAEAEMAATFSRKMSMATGTAVAANGSVLPAPVPRVLLSGASSTEEDDDRASVATRRAAATLPSSNGNGNGHGYESNNVRQPAPPSVPAPHPPPPVVITRPPPRRQMSESSNPRVISLPDPMSARMSAMQSLDLLVSSCRQLKSAYSPRMKQQSLVMLITDIRDSIARSKEYCSAEIVTALTGNRFQARANKTRLLLENDVDQLGMAIERLANSNTPTTQSGASFEILDSARIDVVRLSHDLANDAEALLNILESTDNGDVVPAAARNGGGIGASKVGGPRPGGPSRAPFSAVYSDC